MTPLLIRQGGLRFHWDRWNAVVVTGPDGSWRGWFEVGSGSRPSLDEVHEAIDAYVDALAKS